MPCRGGHGIIELDKPDRVREDEDMTTTTATATVTAELAPLGVQLWPTRSPEYADNFTLRSVSVIRDECGTYVRWEYRGGAVRHFSVGEAVAVDAAALAATCMACATCQHRDAASCMTCRTCPNCGA